MQRIQRSSKFGGAAYRYGRVARCPLKRTTNRQHYSPQRASTVKCRRWLGDALSPFSFEVRGAGVMLEHQAAAINALVVLTPAPVSVNAFVFPATTALFMMKVITFIIKVDCSFATIAPNDREMSLIYFNFHCFHLRNAAAQWQAACGAGRTRLESNFQRTRARLRQRMVSLLPTKISERLSPSGR